MRLLIAAALAGCSWLAGTVPVNPIVDVDVRRESGDYLFLFRNCVNAAQAIDIRRITVTRAGKGGADGVVCQVVWKDFHEPSIKAEWRYGTAPAGYTSPKCEPLVSEESYIVSVAGAGGGSATFTLDKDGAVKVTSQRCK